MPGYNVFSGDRALRDALTRDVADAGAAELLDLGTIAAGEPAQEWARNANGHPPVLRTREHEGRRIDEVEYHPDYHRLMRVAVAHGMHAAPWAQGIPDAHTLRAAKFYVWSQVEAGHGCPISMTYAAVPAIRAQPELAALWEPRLESSAYEPETAPVAQKRGALCGMAMTEKQGGSDVRANTTRAGFAERTPWGDAYVLHGEKWFCSAPMSDAFLVLAQGEEGLTCFLMPRVLPDGSRNAFFIERLKEKLGNRSNASAEVAFDGAWAIRVGEGGRGIQAIVEMVNMTRLDCINGSSSLMRAAVAQAVAHARERSAFGKLLVEQPLMRNVLADLAMESEAAVRFLLRVARAVDRSGNPREAMIKRLGTAVGKYYICKRAPALVGEALECLGGNGYTEETIMPRLYREAPVNSIWEGSGNVNALDVLRALRKDPRTVEAFESELRPALTDPRVRAAARALFDGLRGSRAVEANARDVAERIAVLWQAALLLAEPASPIADLFIDSRIAGRWGKTFGTLPENERHAEIVERA
jgi:putative acyl-CoA dehydrogenase